MSSFWGNSDTFVSEGAFLPSVFTGTWVTSYYTLFDAFYLDVSAKVFFCLLCIYIVLGDINICVEPMDFPPLHLYDVLHRDGIENRKVWKGWSTIID